MADEIDSTETESEYFILRKEILLSYVQWFLRYACTKTVKFWLPTCQQTCFNCEYSKQCLLYFPVLCVHFMNCVKQL